MKKKTAKAARNNWQETFARLKREVKAEKDYRQKELLYEIEAMTAPNTKEKN